LQKIIIILLIWGNNTKGFDIDILNKLFILFGAEVGVEWIKHLSLSKLNELKVEHV
jgi:hypothetical protein